jgi:hypothetical protein
MKHASPFFLDSRQVKWRKQMDRKKLARRARLLLTVAVLVLVSLTASGVQADPVVLRSVTTPRDFFGYDIGEDYKITPWQTHELTGEGLRQGIVEYAHELQRTSNRVRVYQYGTSELGRPMILTVVTSPENWAQMDRIKEILNKLADPRQVASPEEARTLASQGKAVYWLSAAIHATERTSPEVLLRLAYDLAAGNDHWTRDLLDNVVVVMENTINPDGLDMVTDWYYQYLDTPYDGSTPPYYGKYVNHDDNRDFLGLALAESQDNVQARFEWNPTVYHDLHEAMQMLYMSPGPDPTNEAVNPITYAEWLGFAGHNISQLISAGWTGVFTYDYADMWYPGYNHGYSFMHNTNGRFYELQGARLATPRDFTRPGRPQSWYNPAPFPVPFTWHLMDAVNLEEAAIRNDLTYTMDHKDELLFNFYEKGRSNMQKALSQAPLAFVIPANGGDNADVVDLINNLHLGQHIEVDRAETDFVAGGQQFAAGDFVVRLDQPFGLTAKMLLSTQTYPPIKTPYDVTAWTYGLMRDVQVVPLDEALPGGLSLLPVTAELPYAGTLTGGPAQVYVVEHGSNNNLSVALPRLWRQAGLTVWQADVSFTTGGRSFPAGTLLVSTAGGPAEHDWLAALAQELGLTAYAAGDSLPGVSLVELTAPRVGLYTANTSSGTTMPEGWTRLRLDRAGWDYTRLYAADVRYGSLDDFDVIIIPSMTASTLINGSSSSTLPPEYRLGIGPEGLANLESFAQKGGTLVLQGRISTLPMDQGWDIQVEVPSLLAALARPMTVSEEEQEPPDFGGPEPPGLQAGAALLAAAEEPLNCPGSIVRIQVDPSTKVGYGYDAEESLWCESNTPFFDVTPGSPAAVVARYPDDGMTLLQSGFISGESALHGKAAIVDAPFDAGHVILLAPNVLYRAQSTGDFMFFWNALFEGSRTQ